MLENKMLLRVISILIGISLWVMVVSGEGKTITMSVPVKIINVPKGIVAFSDNYSISVKVSGSTRLIESLDNSDILLDIDASKFSVGQSSYRRILPSDFRTPLGIKITDIEPFEIHVTLDKLVSKEVKVTPSVGELKNGYIVDNISLTSNTVTVTGAESILTEMDSVVTVPISVQDKTSSFQTKVGFRDYKGIQSISPSTVGLSITLKENLVTREFIDIPVNCVDLPDGLYVKEPILLKSVRVRGRDDMINDFLSSVIFITDCSQITGAGKYSGTVGYETDLKLDILGINPKKINFEIVDEEVFRN